jgi:hypothetical protein
MKLYRRGHLYLVYRDLDHGYCFNAETGEFTGDVDPRRYLGADARDWKLILDHEDLPEPLLARLILPFSQPE